MTKPKINKYLLCFLLGFGLMALILLPDLIRYKGIFLYTGDYNHQVLPFYFSAHENIRSGNFFWDWYSGLGNSMITSYTGHCLTSPFFWISLLFPAKSLTYLMPVIWCTKFGIAVVTAFAYIKQYVKTENYAVIGALLYGFSGFMIYNTVYSFIEVISFFPLMLLAVDRLVDHGKRGFVAVMVGFMALLSFYFFYGQVIFVVLYFIIKCICKSYKFSWKKFFQLAFEAVCGVLIAMVVLVPILYVMLNTTRYQPAFDWRSLFLYDTGLMRYGKILQSMFMLPDFFGYSNFFMDYQPVYPYGGAMASIAAYLPLFSMTGVISFMWAKKKNWASRLLIACLVIAFVPCFNNLFSGFSPNYYARWLYMPLLIMAMITAYALENSDEISMKPGIITCAAAIPVFTGFFIYNVYWGRFNHGVGAFDVDIFYGWCAVVIAVVSLIIVCLSLYKMKRNKEFTSKLIAITCIGILLSSGFMTMYGLGEGKGYSIDTLRNSQKLTYKLKDDSFFRVQCYYHNFMPMWGMMSIHQLNSISEASLEEFYTVIGMNKTGYIRLSFIPDDLNHVMSMFSGKYYLVYEDHGFTWEDEDYYSITDGTHVIDHDGAFYIFENDNFIPMGFTYDYSVTREQIEKFPETDRAYIMLKALYLDGENTLPAIPEELLNDVSYEAYAKDCENRRAVTASKFEKIQNGFTADITLPKENYVFFSVPYDKGFTAVDGNGNELEICKANIGFMAVKLPAGESTVTFKYVPVGFRTGLALSILGMVLLVGYLVLPKVIKKRS